MGKAWPTPGAGEVPICIVLVRLFSRRYELNVLLRVCLLQETTCITGADEGSEFSI